jgi:uncharacterized repeat protein (TIGR01451 family)
VTYQSGTQTFFATDDITTTVNTVAAAPTITNPESPTAAPGETVTLNYIVTSNANGVDTYTPNDPTNTASGVSGSSVTFDPASMELWGGIVLSSGDGAITVPYGTTPGLEAGDTINIGGELYTVSSITAGTAASTDANGDLVPEVPATIALTPIGDSPAITEDSVAAGTQAGEYKTLEVEFTAGTLTTPGEDGIYSTTFEVSTGIDPTVEATTTAVTTTVSSPAVTIVKVADKATANSGDTITYMITITNTHATAEATNVTVIDPIPAYTAYVANSTRLNGITVTGDGATSPLLSPGLLVDEDESRTPGVAATGILPAGEVATITFQVTVN